MRVFRERAPTEVGRWTDGVSATVLGHLGRQGYAGAEGDASPLWLLVGPGEMPAWCTGRPGVRCGRLTVEGQGLDGDAAVRLGGGRPGGGRLPRLAT